MHSISHFSKTGAKVLLFFDICKFKFLSGGKYATKMQDEGFFC